MSLNHKDMHFGQQDSFLWLLVIKINVITVINSHSLKKHRKTSHKISWFSLGESLKHHLVYLVLNPCACADVVATCQAACFHIFAWHSHFGHLDKYNPGVLPKLAGSEQHRGPSRRTFEKNASARCRSVAALQDEGPDLAVSEHGKYAWPLNVEWRKLIMIITIKFGSNNEIPVMALCSDNLIEGSQTATVSDGWLQAPAVGFWMVSGEAEALCLGAMATAQGKVYFSEASARRGRVFVGVCPSSFWGWCSVFFHWK